MSVKTTVLDAGARYGIHPTWKGYGGELNYVMFEPDREEAQRLAQSYAQSRPDVRVENKALGESSGELEMQIYRHHGQSSHYQPNTENLWFAVTRPGEGDIIGSYTAPMVTVDDYAQDNGLAFDFMKLDTEGHELSILKGAEQQLKEHVLAVRAEVHFDYVLHDIPLFPDLHSFFMDRGFQLLNLGYDGQGQHLNGFADGPRYGVLLGCDAVWVRRLNDLGGANGAEKILKYALFCLINDAADLAMAALLKGIDDWSLDYTAYGDAALYRELDVQVQRLCRRLQDRPGQDASQLEAIYRKIFGRDLKPLHLYFQSEEINPLK